MQPVAILMNNTRGQNKLDGKYFQGLSLLRCFTVSTAEELQIFRRIVVPSSSLLFLLDCLTLMKALHSFETL
jgi:hypothetical protein